MSRKVYLGRLNNQVREKDVERFFKGFRVRSVMLKNGYGFVEFDDARDADDAVYDLNGKELCGDRIIVEHARGPSRRGGGSSFGGSRGGGGGGSSDFKPVWLDKYGPPVRTPYRVYIENLSSRVSWQDLKDYLRQAGEVTYADAHKEKRNQGIVEFASYRDMKNAIEKLDDTEINGRRIQIIEDKSRSRRHSRSASRSRSRSPRSRSPHSRSRERSANDKRQNSRSRSRQSERSRSASRSKSRSQPPRDESNYRNSVDRNNDYEDDKRSNASD